jgi:hypothetical protein
MQIFCKFQDAPGNLAAQMANSRLSYGLYGLKAQILELNKIAFEAIEGLSGSWHDASDEGPVRTCVKQLVELTHQAAKTSQALKDQTTEATNALHDTACDIDRSLWNLKGIFESATTANFRETSDDMKRILKRIETIQKSVTELQDRVVAQNERLVYVAPYWFLPVSLVVAMILGLVMWVFLPPPISWILGAPTAIAAFTALGVRISQPSMNPNH